MPGVADVRWQYVRVYARKGWALPCARLPFGLASPGLHAWVVVVFFAHAIATVAAETVAYFDIILFTCELLYLLPFLVQGGYRPLYVAIDHQRLDLAFWLVGFHGQDVDEEDRCGVDGDYSPVIFWSGDVMA